MQAEPLAERWEVLVSLREQEQVLALTVCLSKVACEPLDAATPRVQNMQHHWAKGRDHVMGLVCTKPVPETLDGLAWGAGGR